MKPTFNLIDQKWILCTDNEKKIVKHSLSSLFINLNQLSDLADPYPVVNASLLRFLLVLIIDIYNPSSIQDIGTLFSEGLNPKKTAEYFQNFKDRFDLFSPTNPFYQADDDRVRPKSVLKLVHHFASGNNATLFDHHTESEGVSLQPDEAARYLITNQSFGLGGLSGIPDKFTNSPPQQGINFFIKGNNLFETLLLNCFLYRGDKSGGIPLSENDKPAWRMDDPYIERKIPFGLKDYLTWHNRRIRFLPEETENGIIVRKMTDGPGLRLDDSFIDGQSIRDPFHFYYQGSTAILPQKFSESKAIWRDSAALFSFEANNQNQLLAPEIILHLHFLVNRRIIFDNQLFRLSALGMASDKAKILFYREEELPIPISYLKDINLVRELGEMIELAEKCSRKLFGAINVFARVAVDGINELQDLREKKKLSPDAEKFRNHLGGDRFYWIEVEKGFLSLLLDLPNASQKAKKIWEDHLYSSAFKAFEKVINFSGDSTRYLEARVLAEKSLWFSLNEIFDRKEVKE